MYTVIAANLFLTSPVGLIHTKYVSRLRSVLFKSAPHICVIIAAIPKARRFS